MSRPYPCNRMCGIPALNDRQTPLRFISRIKSQSSSPRCSGTGSTRVIPAFATTMSSEPNSETARAARPSRSAWRRTSTSPMITRAPDITQSRRTNSMSCPSGGCHAKATSAPASANIRAVAAPIPEAAPVMSATRDSSENGHVAITRQFAKAVEPHCLDDKPSERSNNDANVPQLHPPLAIRDKATLGHSFAKRGVRRKLPLALAGATSHPRRTFGATSHFASRGPTHSERFGQL